MPPPGGHGRGCARGTFEVPISRRHQAVHFKGRNSRRGRSGPGPSEGRPQSPPCQDHVAEQTPVSCSSKLLGTLKESSTATTCSSTPQAVLPDSLSSSPGPNILVRKPPDWYFSFYIRIDLSKSFHTYPDVGGPFKSLQEAENAIDCYLRCRQHEMMCKESLDELSPMDRLIKRSLYWPDGRRRKCSEAFASEHTLTETGHLLRALVDKYNEDHNLFGTKGADGIENLFFAEVKHIEESELLVSCFLMINTDANGCCDGCTNNGSIDMKHPNDAKAYNAGHPGGYLRFDGGERDPSDDDEDVKTEEDRLRYIFKGLDNPDILKEFFTSPHATTTFIED